VVKEENRLHPKLPSESTSHQKTVRRGKNQARVVATWDLEFTDEALKSAPEWDKSGIALARKNIETSGLNTEKILEELRKVIELYGLKDKIILHAFHVEAAP
jgi:hypothetical protein